jgi:ribosome-associated protein
MTMPPRTSLTPLTKVAVGALEDLKGQDIKLLDVRKLTTVTDTMIVCTGTSSRHVSSLAQNVVEASKKAGFRPMGIEGKETGEWVLVDLGDVVVHVMQSQARVHYQLEKLWAVDEEPVSVSTKPKKTGTEKPTKQKAAQPARKAAKKAKKPAAKKAAARKPAVKKAAGKKAVAKKTASKPAARKAASRR